MTSKRRGENQIFLVKDDYININSLWKIPSCITKWNIAKASFQIFLCLFLPPSFSFCVFLFFTSFILSKITWSNFKMFSNLYPLRKDISQMLNDAITCSSEDCFMKIIFFKNDSILNGEEQFSWEGFFMGYEAGGTTTWFEDEWMTK